MDKNEVKMSVESLWISHQVYTKEFSTTTRQIAFSLIAVCWVLRPDGYVFPVDSSLTIALVLACCYFIFDCLQYAFGAIVHFVLAKYCEYLGIGSTVKSGWWDSPAYFFLFLKTVSLIACIFFLFHWVKFK